MPRVLMIMPSAIDVNPISRTLNYAYIITTIISFILTWCATIGLLKNYTHKMGKFAYWIVLIIPLAYFISQFLVLSLGLFGPLLISNPIFFGTPIHTNLYIKQTYWGYYIWYRFLVDSKEHSERQCSKKLFDNICIWLPAIVYVKSSDASNFYSISAFWSRDDIVCRFIFLPCASWNLFFSYFNLSGCKFKKGDQASSNQRIKNVAQYWISSGRGRGKKKGTTYSQNKQESFGRGSCSIST